LRLADGLSSSLLSRLGHDRKFLAFSQQPINRRRLFFFHDLVYMRIGTLSAFLSPLPSRIAGGPFFSSIRSNDSSFPCLRGIVVAGVSSFLWVVSRNDDHADSLPLSLNSGPQLPPPRRWRSGEFFPFPLSLLFT